MMLLIAVNPTTCTDWAHPGLRGVHALALRAAQGAKSKGLLFRIRSTVADLNGRTPGLRTLSANAAVSLPRTMQNAPLA